MLKSDYYDHLYEIYKAEDNLSDILDDHFDITMENLVFNSKDYKDEIDEAIKLDDLISELLDEKEDEERSILV